MSEVRQLRLAIERSTLTVPRIQVVLQRMQMQQNRIDQLTARAQDLKSKIRESASNDAQLRTDLQQTEIRMAQEQDPIIRKEEAKRLEVMKQQLQHESIRDQQERAYEVELSTQLNVEQAKLDELVRQLNSLEASLSK